jgi:hypothetical protein
VTRPEVYRGEVEFEGAILVTAAAIVSFIIAAAIAAGAS